MLVNSVGCPNAAPSSWPALRAELRKVASSLCSDCRRRVETNPLRVLDCKVEADQPVIDKLPSILDHLCDGLPDALRRCAALPPDRGIAFEVRPRLVRGLDYYTRTTFEITHGALGAQNSVLGGGRYDGLAEALGSKVRSPGIGFSIGEDRLIMSLERRPRAPGAAGLDVFMAPIGEPAPAPRRHAGARVAALGKERWNWDWTASSSVLWNSPTSSARAIADRWRDEIAAGNYQLKDMATGEQQTVTRSELFERLGLKL